jgi:hypothetical protein
MTMTSSSLVREVLGDCRERFRAVARGANAVSLFLEQVAQEVLDVGVVIDDEHGALDVGQLFLREARRVTGAPLVRRGSAV